MSISDPLWAVLMSTALHNTYISVQLVVPHGFDVVEVEWSEHLKKWPCWMYVYWLSELLAKLKTHKRNFETLPSHEKCSSLMNDVLTWSQQLTSHRLGGL